MKVMVVDDEQDVELLFRQHFRKEIKDGKIHMEFAFSGHECVDALKNRDKADIVLILSDINMPGMHGIELLGIIKREFPDIKVFMITAYGNDDNYRKAMELGADDYINKPIDFDGLKEKIFSIGG